jgi:nucleoside-diphosphate-sugar epimerase
MCAAYLGEGLNRWPAVHRLDAAHLFRLALEKGGARAYYHGVAEEGVPFREMAEVIGHRLKVPVLSIAPEEAANHFAWFAHFATMDVPASSQKTRELLGWKPKQCGLIAETKKNRDSYFKT